MPPVLVRVCLLAVEGPGKSSPPTLAWGVLEACGIGSGMFLSTRCRTAALAASCTGGTAWFAFNLLRHHSLPVVLCAGVAASLMPCVAVNSCSVHQNVITCVRGSMWWCWGIAAKCVA